MAVRTTASAVKEILRNKSSVADSVFTPFIASASIIIDENLIGEDKYDETDDSTLLELIERWLSAHAYLLMDEPVESEKVDVLSRKFLSKNDLGFDQTKQGQMALRLDHKGILAGLNEQSKGEQGTGGGRTAGVTWGGSLTTDSWRQ